MRLIRACAIAFAAACGLICGLGVVGMIATPPEERPSHFRRERRRKRKAIGKLNRERYEPRGRLDW